MKINPIVSILLISLLAIFISCNSTKKASVSKISDLYNIWQIDSVQITGKILPNNALNGSTMEFKKSGVLVSTINNKVQETRVEIKDWAIINLDKPDDPPVNIKELTNEKLVLEGDEGGMNTLRLVLSSLKQ